jgi:hypothetical protein
MGSLMFFMAAIAACLLWSAAFIAMAARTERVWLRRLLTTLAIVVPPLTLVPWVAATGVLAFVVKLGTNWFVPTVFAFVSAIVGGLWICRGGFMRSDTGDFAAASWPVIGLAAMFLLAKAVCFGTLLFIDNAVVAETRAMRVEAAQLMMANLPPAPQPDDDAAPLYLRACAAIEADKEFSTAGSPLEAPVTTEIGAAAVREILARHAATLELVRRAADRPGCRFVRDWTRPSISMLLPEIQSLRQAGRLLALAARREAADGDAAAALRDIVRIHRIGVHAAGEPILICGLVGQALDAVALETLAAVLPTLKKDDLPLLDEPAFRDFIDTAPSYQRHFLGEEAFGLATAADLAEGTREISPRSLFGAFDGKPSPGWGWPFDVPISLLYRCFLLPTDIAGYRETMGRYQEIEAGNVPSKAFIDVAKQITALEADIVQRRQGLFASLLAPALSPILTSEARGRVKHRAAEVLVAATRARLTAGSIPESIEALVPTSMASVPRDPFTDGKPLFAEHDDGSFVVWSVGPDGEDDGGPAPAGTDTPEGDDDVGLRMATSAGDTTTAP